MANNTTIVVDMSTTCVVFAGRVALYGLSRGTSLQRSVLSSSRNPFGMSAMQLNKDGQPETLLFNRKRNLEKAVSGLFGIVQGLTCDQELVEREMLFLDVWLRSQEALNTDPDLIDIVDLVGDILRDGIVTEDELLDLKSLLSDVLQYREKPYFGEEARINELVGVLSGIAADGVLDDKEIGFLAHWLSNNSEIENQWPAMVIRDRLKIAMADNILSKDERDDLLQLVQEIVGGDFENTSIAHGMATAFFEDLVDGVEFEGRCFCFTGKFVSGARRAVENSAILRGGLARSDVTNGVDYLVIGTLASRDWRFSSHGRKIEKALKLREGGKPIKIITERSWVKFLL